MLARPARAFSGWKMVMAFGALALAACAASAQPANDNIANASIISGLAGTTNGVNTGATLEAGESSPIATQDNSYGAPVAESVWYSWTAPASGNVSFDTIGSSFDTVLAGYTGNSIATLTMLTADDDIFDGNGNLTSTNSQISFYAVANTTYYIAVYGSIKSTNNSGTVVLNWSLQTPGFSAGQFRLTSTGYTVSQRESIPATAGGNMSATAGARVSVTRVGGAAGRVQVAYTVTNGFTTQTYTQDDFIEVDQTITLSPTLTVLSYITNIIDETMIYSRAYTNHCTNSDIVTITTTTPAGTTVANTNGPINLNTNISVLTVTNPDLSITIYSTNYGAFSSSFTVTNEAAIAFDPSQPTYAWDYVPASGVLTFNDYEMTKDIYVTLGSNNLFAATGNGNSLVQVVLNSVTLDPNEDPTIPAPTLDPARSSATLTVQNMWEIENGFASGMCDPWDATNIINFERSTLRVTRGAGTAKIAVFRGFLGGGMYVGYADFTQSSTMYYSIDDYNAFDDWNSFGPQSGSDYAIPDLATKTAPENVVDFASPTIGTVNFPANVSVASWLQYISVPITNNDLVEFNKDLLVEFYADSGHKWQQCVPGNVYECWVTILFDKQPAGAVDRTYNVDNSTGTVPPNNPNPGALGPVYALALQGNGAAIVAGDFTAYNETNASRIARVQTDGSSDVVFISNTGLGADGFIDALAIDNSGGIFLGGGFSSFNGAQRNGIARLNSDGTLDTTLFNPGYGLRSSGVISSIALQPNGQILIAGNFTQYNTNNVNCIARLNPDGSLDSTFNPGNGPLDAAWVSLTSINSLALQPDGKIIIGGDFTEVDGVSRNNIARLNADGSLDTTFDPGGGANDLVNAVAVDANNRILVGGVFTQMGTTGGSQGIARLNSDGSLDTTFGVGSGANDIVNSILLQPDGGILLGGQFTSINQTRRVSMARLLPDGTLDTTFMDTAYNQFAGLINPYYSASVNPRNPVYCMALQNDGNLLIGGSFMQVGGGFTRADILPRSSVARIIGGATPGPGNISMAYSSYSAAGQVTNSTATITINRINGTLGPAMASVEPVTLHPGPGAAAYGQDFVFAAAPVIYGTTWKNTWMLSDGVSGPNYKTSVTILPNLTNGNSKLNLQLTQPLGSDIFFLGGMNKQTSVGLTTASYREQDGENIPLGVALGQSISPLNILRNNPHPGTLSFGSMLYVTNANSVRAAINVIRTGGTDGNVTVSYKTVNGTAVAGTDYASTTGSLTFGSGTQASATNQVFFIPLGTITQAAPDRYLYVQIYNPGAGSGGTIKPTLGLTNAEVLLVNNVSGQGNVNFSGGAPITIGTSNLMVYGTNEDRKVAQLSVSRLGGSSGRLVVNVATSSGTAVNGVNYVGFTNQLAWNANISGPQQINIPIQDDGLVTTNLTVNVTLYGATVNGAASTLALGAITNAILVLTNVDQPGSLQFSQPTYSYDKGGGTAIIPVVRTGGASGTVTATFMTQDGTAHAGTDYTATTVALTLTNGQLSTSLRVPIIDTGIQTGDLTFNVLLTNVSPVLAAGTVSNAVVTIIDTDTTIEPPGTPDPAFNSGFNGPVFALALEPSDNKLLVGGSFTYANGIGRQRIARMNPDGTLDTAFSSYLTTQGASDTVRAIVVQTDGRILVGGSFTNFNTATMNRVARLNYDGSLDSTFSSGAGADNAIYSMAEAFINGSRFLYLGGSFATYNGTPQNTIARLNNTGSLDTSFGVGSGPNGTVFALAVQPDGKVVIGGDFTAVNGVTNCNHIARLNTDGSVDLTFNPGSGTDNSVHSLAIQLDGRVVIGGLFANVNGYPFSHIARLNTDGSVDSGFAPGVGANGDVETISLQPDTRIVLGGTFTACNGVTRNYVTRLNPDGTVDPTINFGLGADGFVAASVIQPDAKIVLGGGFLNFDGASHPYLVRIYGGSMAGSGTFQFLSANFLAHESSTNAVISVIRTGGTSGGNADGSGSVSVSYATSPDTAVAGVNYLDVSGSLTFPEGEVIQTFVVPVLDDGVVTSNLILDLTLSANGATAPAVVGNNAANLTILNDDSSLSFSSAFYSAPKNVINGQAQINIIRNGGLAGSASVVFSTVAGGTAVPGSDYTPVSVPVNFAPGVSNVVVNVPILNNPQPEGNLTVALQLSNPSGSVLSAPANATLSIVDTVNSPGQLAFDSAAYTVTEGGGVGYTNVYITVDRTLGSYGTVTANFYTLDGTATSGAKYIQTNGVLTFAAGETTKTFPVFVRNTSTAEGPETFSVVLTNVGGGAIITSPATTVVTIINTNMGVGFVSGTSSFTEPSGAANGTLQLQVARYNNTNGTISVNYSTTNGSAVSGVNFVGVSNGSLTFNPGETLKTITIYTMYDPRPIGDLTFTVGLANPTGGAQLAAPKSVVVTDHDINTAISFVTATNSVARNAGYLAVYVTNSNPNVDPVSVYYSTTDGSAVAGKDYVATSGTLSFTNGAALNGFLVNILVNNSVQSNRTFNITLSNPSGAGVLQPWSTEVVTIVGTNTPLGLSFSTPIIIGGLWGTTNANNTLGAPESQDPPIAGQSASAPVWFEWTAPAYGEVALDTIGSANTNGLKLDTVLGVFTGSSLQNLNQVAANDDLYPLMPETQYNYDAQSVFNTNITIFTNSYVFNGTLYLQTFTNTSGTYAYADGDYTQPFWGPSGLRFTALAGTTYYIAVDTKLGYSYGISNGQQVLEYTRQTGNVQLSWAYHPGGVFRFATEGEDLTGNTDTNGNPLLLYECAESEGDTFVNTDHRIIGPVTAGEIDTTFGAYYTYDVNGLLVTVTRVAGSVGRVAVDYTTADGDKNIVKNGDVPAVAGIDYRTASGTLIFDDYEMSKTIYIPIIDDEGSPRLNRDFMVLLSNPRRDAAENGAVSAPRVDPVFGKVLCRILDCDIDPRGPTALQVLTTNAVTGDVTTNMTIADASGNLLEPTNAVFNFSKKSYRVPRDVQQYWGTPVTIYVNRMGTNTSSQTVYYRFDNFFLTKNGIEDENYTFPLQAGSDYATPFTATPPKDGTVFGPTNFDFQGVGGESGTITFPGGKNNPFQSQPIHFTVFNDHVTGFNKDIHVGIYQEDSNGNPVQGGMVAECTVTILFDDTVPPAGSVDEFYNPDFASDLALITNDPALYSIVTSPGASGPVNALAITANNEALIAGGFQAYIDSVSSHPVYGIALLRPDGQLDTAFNSGTGIDVGHQNFIQSLALTPDNKIVIGGNFTSYNNQRHNYIARLNSDGSVDTAFGTGSGFNAMVRSVLVTPDDKILVGGDFTSYAGTPVQYVVRLNSDGSLDNTFNAGNIVTGPVKSMALSPSQPFLFTHSSPTAEMNEDDQTLNLKNQTAGILYVTAEALSLAGTDDLQIYYGSTNVANGTGVLIYDTGSFGQPANPVLSFAVPFGPTNRLTTNVLTVVMNPGGSATSNLWSYTVSMPGNNSVVIGGAFGVNGQLYSNIARLNADGSLDTSFNPGLGPDGDVLSLVRQQNDQIVLGGSFQNINGISLNRLARLNPDGTIDSSFANGTGADDAVYSVVTDPIYTNFYVGGKFTLMNGTHRLGFSRLYVNGTVDTTFLDTAYNQYAGLPRIFYGDAPGTVYASALQSNGNIIIGGSFQEVGGGQADMEVRYALEAERGLMPSTADPNLWVSKGGGNLEPKSRDGVRNRSNIARLIGGGTPGPGNIGMTTSSFAANNNQGFESIALVRANGSLGYASANFSVLPGIAQPGQNYGYYSPAPLYPIAWEYEGPTRQHSDGLYGNSGDMASEYPWFEQWGVNGPAAVNIQIYNNSAAAGNLSAQLQLANPVDADQFYLGGQNIPLGVALGTSQAPLTVVDVAQHNGVVGFDSPAYTATNSPTVITVIRTNGTDGTITVKFQTVTNGSSAVANLDYRPTNGVVTLGVNVASNTFPVTILNNSYISPQEKTVNVQLYDLPIDSGAQFGLTNSVIRLINPNYPGFVNLSSNIYAGNVSAGVINFVVTRNVGNKGTMSVQYVTSDGTPNSTRVNTAVNGVDYVGATSTTPGGPNTLTWNSGDVTPRIVSIPLMNPNSLGGNKLFTVTLVNPILNGASSPAILGSITNATMDIVNDHSVGTVQFSASSYQVNENAGFATVTVTRSGSTFATNVVSFSTSDGTAVNGVNYVATNNTLTFLPGQIIKTFGVALIDDHKTNPPPAAFYFSLALSTVPSANGPASGSVLGSPVNASVHIVDSESYNQPPGAVDTSFGANLNGGVSALGIQSSGQIVAAGAFTLANGAGMNRIARFNTDGSLDSGFLSGMAGANDTIYALASQTDDRIVIGGNFTSVDGINSQKIARLMVDGSWDSSFNTGAGADNSVFALTEAFLGGSRYIYAGGAFSYFGPAFSPGVVRLDNTGAVDPSFNVGDGVIGNVYAIAVYPTNSINDAGMVMVGGAFTNFDYVYAGNLVRLHTDGSLDTNFLQNFSADGAVRAIAIQPDGAVVIGGDFANVDGVAAGHIARINADGTLDTAFNNAAAPGVNGTVNAVSLQADGRIVVVGQFSAANGVTRYDITRLLPTGSVDPSINFGSGANGAINALLIQPADGDLVIGGDFTAFNNMSCDHIARLFGGSVSGSGTFQFTSSGFQVDETGSYAAITIERLGGTAGTNADGTGEVFVGFATSNNTAVAGVNYTATTNYVDFPMGEMLRTIYVPVQDDGVVTPNLTVNLALSNPTPGTDLGDQRTALLTIINDDSTVEFLQPNYPTKLSANALMSITLMRLGSTSGSCAVNFLTTTNGTAVIGTDYNPTNAAVVFTPGQVTNIVQVPLLYNPNPSGNPSVTMTLTNMVNTFAGSPSNAMITIQDQNNNPGNLFFATTNFTANAADGTALLTVLRTNGTAGAVGASFTVVPGTAFPGVDYQLLNSNNTVSLGGNITSNTIGITLINRTGVPHGPVTLSVYLSNPTGGAGLINPTNTTLTINNTNPAVAFVLGTNTVAEDAVYASVVVQRYNNSNLVSTVKYATTNGTAMAGIDFSNVSGTLTFGLGETLKSIQVPLINRSNITDLAFGMVLSTPVNAALMAPSNTVIDLEGSAAGISFVTNSTSVMGDGSVIAIPVVCSNLRVEPQVTTNNGPLQVSFSTADGTARAGFDYNPTNGVLVFTNGVGTNYVYVQLLNNTNSYALSNLTFNVNLSNVTAPGTIAPYGSETISIIEMESGLSFSQSAYSAFKNAGSATITVNRYGYTNSVVAVNFSVTNGTAVAGQNFYPTNGTLIFTNGVTSQSFNVALIAPAGVGPNFYALLALSSPTAGAEIVAPGVATLTLVETGGSYVAPAGSQMLTNYTSHLNDGIIGSNDTVKVMFAFRDAAGLNVNNLVAYLLATNGVLSPTPASQTYGPLTAYSHSVSMPFTFTAHGTNMLTIAPTFQLYDGVKYIGPATFVYTIGSWTTTIANSNAIVINDGTSASPYPSLINVSGLGNTLIKATVTITNLSHQSMSDVGALVVSPTTNTLLMGNVGGSGQHALHVTLTFDDAATNSLPQNGAIITGTNKPTQYNLIKNFP